MKIENAMTLADVRLALRDALTPKYGEREATAMARIILTTLKGWDMTRLLADEGREASDYIKSRTSEILNNLLNDMPIQYALGQTVFYGLTLKVGPGVLIPRPETEELVDLIVKQNPGDDLRVLDLCTGNGAIALALSRYLPFSRITAVDISPEAIAVARENAQSLKARIDIIEDDVFNPEIKSELSKNCPYNIIVSNPPYVDESEISDMERNVVDYEPHMALFVPDDNPLVYYRRIAELATDLLQPGGKLYFELNPRHAAELKRMLEEKGFKNIEIIKDVHGNDRFAACTFPS